MASRRTSHQSLQSITHHRIKKGRQGRNGWSAGVEPVCLSNTRTTLGGNCKGDGDGLIVDTHGDLCHIGSSRSACLALRTWSSLCFVTALYALESMAAFRPSGTTCSRALNALWHSGRPITWSGFAFHEGALTIPTDDFRASRTPPSVIWQFRRGLRAQAASS